MHDEEEPLSPLSVYGQTKAAGDIAVAGCPRHYIMRSSWVIGEGRNFVKTMKGLSDRVADPDDNGDKVVPVTTADYYASAASPVAPRPVHSALDLSKLESVGFHMPDWEEELKGYMSML